MSTGGRARKPAGRRAAEISPSPRADQLSASGAADDTTRSAAPAAGVAAAPDDVQQLKQEIEETRGLLGETVEQLAAKADVKSRARAKTAELSGRVMSMAGQATKGAAARAGSARGQLAGTSAAARDRVAAVSAPVWESAEPLRRSVARGASTARQHRVPLAVAAGAIIVGYLLIRSWGRR